MAARLEGQCEWSASVRTQDDAHRRNNTQKMKTAERLLQSGSARWSLAAGPGRSSRR